MKAVDANVLTRCFLLGSQRSTGLTEAAVDELGGA